MPKPERLYRTRESVELVGLILLADGLLSISAEYGCEASGELRGREALVYYRGCSPGEELFELEELEGLGLRLKLVEGSGGRSARDILERARTPALRVLEELKPLSLLTSSSGVEYALLVLRSGDVYVAEGGPRRVVLPRVEEVVLEAHTHQEVCLPSSRDLSEAAQRFMEGLYASGVVSPLCTLLVYRVGPVLEEDVEALMELSREPERVVWATELGNLRVLLVPG